VIETLAVVGVVGLLAGLGLVGPLVPPDQWMVAGAVITGVGLLAGVPTGFWYHVALHRCLAPRLALPPRWWLHPVALHPALRASERRAVLSWFTAGGVGFAIAVVGCAITLLGVVAQWLA
jgi:hypothetical protein